eukprot:GCRY01004643.1.p1 GENE.GCRY01004643.1~~GCRY01004643.1.p1  ORF type:complete len:902 (+),score=40.43 GCRY01004643.1:85-2790(+)
MSDESEDGGLVLAISQYAVSSFWFSFVERSDHLMDLGVNFRSICLLCARKILQAKFPDYATVKSLLNLGVPTHYHFVDVAIWFSLDVHLLIQLLDCDKNANATFFIDTIILQYDEALFVDSFRVLREIRYSLSNPGVASDWCIDDLSHTILSKTGVSNYVAFLMKRFFPLSKLAITKLLKPLLPEPVHSVGTCVGPAIFLQQGRFSTFERVSKTPMVTFSEPVSTSFSTPLSSFNQRKRNHAKSSSNTSFAFSEQLSSSDAIPGIHSPFFSRRLQTDNSVSFPHSPKHDVPYGQISRNAKGRSSSNTNRVHLSKNSIFHSKKEKSVNRSKRLSLFRKNKHFAWRGNKFKEKQMCTIRTRSFRRKGNCLKKHLHFTLTPFHQQSEIRHCLLIFSGSHLTSPVKPSLPAISNNHRSNEADNCIAQTMSQSSYSPQRPSNRLINVMHFLGSQRVPRVLSQRYFGSMKAPLPENHPLSSISYDNRQIKQFRPQSFSKDKCFILRLFDQVFRINIDLRFFEQSFFSSLLSFFQFAFSNMGLSQGGFVLSDLFSLTPRLHSETGSRISPLNKNGLAQHRKWESFNYFLSSEKVETRFDDCIQSSRQACSKKRSLKSVSSDFYPALLASPPAKRICQGFFSGQLSSLAHSISAPSPLPLLLPKPDYPNPQPHGSSQPEVWSLPTRSFPQNVLLPSALSPVKKNRVSFADPLSVYIRPPPSFPEPCRSSSFVDSAPHGTLHIVPNVAVSQPEPASSLRPDASIDSSDIVRPSSLEKESIESSLAFDSCDSRSQPPAQAARCVSSSPSPQHSAHLCAIAGLSFSSPSPPGVSTANRQPSPSPFFSGSLRGHRISSAYLFQFEQEQALKMTSFGSTQPLIVHSHSIPSGAQAVRLGDNERWARGVVVCSRK